MQLGVSLKAPIVQGGQITLPLEHADGTTTNLVVDHVIAATGYRVGMTRLKFMHSALQNSVRTVDDTPLLKSNFESSVRGLFMVGAASANCFGPLARFACGARFTARRITPSLAA